VLEDAAQLAQRVHLDLAHALARDTGFETDFTIPARLPIRE